MDLIIAKEYKMCPLVYCDTDTWIVLQVCVWVIHHADFYLGSVLVYKQQMYANGGGDEPFTGWRHEIVVPGERQTNLLMGTHKKITLTYD